jgi:hypothetical protein
MLLLQLTLSACTPPGPRPARSTAAPAAPAPPPALDADADGHAPPADCEDDDPLTFPGADERCDAADNDCDGLVDEDPVVDAPTWYLDVDADGYGSSVDAVTSCAPPSEEWVLNGDDCEPTNPDIHPGMMEVCNGEDDDCDGLADNPPISGDTLWYPDVDRDGFGDASADGLCEPEPGFVSNNLDCGDGDAEVKPGAVEVCNDGVDNDCSGVAEGCEWPTIVDVSGVVELASTSGIGSEFGSGLGVYDANGDGYDDVVIGEPYLPGPGGVEGGLFVFLGPVGASLTTADAALWRTRAASLSGIGIGVAHSDLNGDGYDDSIVTSISATASGYGEGGVFIAHGPMGVGGGTFEDEFTSRRFHTGPLDDYFGRAISVLGDVSGDSIPDIGVGVETFRYPASDGAVLVVSGDVAGVGSAWADAEASLVGVDGQNLGWCVAGGDYDGDGMSDVVVGAPRSTGGGAGLVFLGPLRGTISSRDADVEVSARSGSADLGRGCAVLGDTNGDGSDDIAFSSSGDALGWVGVFRGGAGVTSLSASDAEAQLIGTSEGSAGYFGASVQQAGDLNQDGAQDIIVGETQWHPLAARVWFGPISGTVLDVDADTTLLLPPAEFGGCLRNMVGGRDVSGDGVPDVVLADAFHSTEGRVWLVPGIGF